MHYPCTARFYYYYYWCSRWWWCVLGNLTWDWVGVGINMHHKFMA